MKTGVTVGVISALQQEIDELVTVMDGAESGDVAGWRSWTGRIGEQQVILARAGLGKVNTAALTALVWDRYRPRLMAFTGVAGALDPSLSVGDIVIAERTIQHDAGLITPSGLERYQAGHVPFFNPTEDFGYVPSPSLLARAKSVGESIDLDPVLGRRPAVRVGRVVTGDQFLQDPSTRDRLFTELGAQVVEMEGAALAQFASRVGCDHIVVRAVSDLAGADSSIDFERFLPEVAANSAHFISALIDRLEEDDGNHPVGT
jgi:adenosylhomocysteine nucleosidase